MMEGMGYNLDPNMLVGALTRDNDGGNEFGGNGMLWIFLLLLFGVGGNGFGGFGNRGGEGIAVTEAVDASIAKAQAAGVSDQLVLQAINGNKDAINALANSVNVNFSEVQECCSNMKTAIAQVSGQIGMSTQEIVNSVQAGNCQVLNAVKDCCCNTQSAIKDVNYNILSQTNALNNSLASGFSNLSFQLERGINSVNSNTSGLIQAQTQEMRAGFQGIRDYLTQEKMDQLRSELQAAQLTLSNAAQTKAIEEYIANLIVGCPCTGTTTTGLTLR